MRLARAGLGLVLLAAPAFPDIRGWNVRLTGGWTTVDGGDFSAGLVGMNDLIRAEYSLVGGSWRAPRTGFDLGVEVEAELSPRFGLALGLGYLRAEKPGAVEYDYWIIRSKEEIRPVFCAVPLTLTAGFRLPVWGRLSLRAAGGPGLYFVRVGWDRDYVINTLWVVDQGSETWRASAARFGVQGRLAIEFAVNARIAVVLEGGGRWLRWSGARGPWTLKGSDSLSGDYLESGARTLWRYDLAADGKGYPLWALSDAEPRPARSSGVGLARIDLSGFSLRAGLRVSL